MHQQQSISPHLESKMNQDDSSNSESKKEEKEEQVQPEKNEVAAQSKEDQLYRGKWTEEEEAYAYFLIEEFRLGNLSIPHGTTLRGYLARKLDCAPKR
jgi:sortase (surface protein transpeptidase)